MNDGFSIKCPSLFGLATSMSKEIRQKVATVPASVKVSKRSETEERENRQRSVEKFCGKSELVFFYCLLPSLQPASLEFCMLSPFETFTNMQVYTYNFFPLTKCHDRMTR